MVVEGALDTSAGFSHDPGNLEGIILGLDGTCSLFQDGVCQLFVIADRGDVDGGDNEDNQTQGPLIDMIVVKSLPHIVPVVKSNNGLMDCQLRCIPVNYVRE